MKNLSKIKYYIYDTNDPLDLKSFYQLDKQEFYESLEYNYTVAKYYGDEIKPLTKIKEEFKSKQNIDEEINNFIYIKLTTKEVKEYFDL